MKIKIIKSVTGYGVRGAKVGEEVDVKDSDARRLVELKYAIAVDVKQEKSLDDMTVQELVSFAKQNEINLDGKTKKADIIEAINNALQASPEKSLDDMTNDELVLYAESKNIEGAKDNTRDELLELLKTEE